MRIGFSIFLVFCVLTIKAQEVKIFPQSMVGSYKKSATDTLSLPFFDDFSDGQINTHKWINKGVIVSFYSSVFPPSIGAAMFDAVDGNGNFYAENYETVTPSDTLTSLPIDLYYPGEESVYLSFFYQPQGQLDMPEPSDSLVLQFYSPITKTWETVWKTTGFENVIDQPRFKSVIIKIDDDKYLQKGFQFRFINYTSLGASTYRTLVSNCDYWFVDYVYLDKNRYMGDTVFRDVALQYPIEFRFDRYTAVPAEHYSLYDFNLSFLVRFRNNDALNRTIDSLYVVFKDQQSLQILDTLFLGSYSFPPNGNFFVKKENLQFRFPISGQTIFNLTTKLVTDQFDPDQNNIAQSKVSITNYYAYDDGSAEAGYGLFGNGTYHALVAAKFFTPVTDTLTGVQIYFGKTYRFYQPHYFYLMIWANDTASPFPDSVIYEQMGVEIDFDNLNAFQTFWLDSPVVVSDTFFIGWKKTDEQLMNVGLDLTNPIENYKFYNINGKWTESSITGNLMIRPIFGRRTVSNIVDSDAQIKVFPNPAISFLNISLPAKGCVKIYDLNGRFILSEFVDYNLRLDITGLTPGLYIIQIIMQDRIYTRKFIKM